MDEGLSERRKARLPFVIAGIVIGTLGNGLYLYRINLQGLSLSGMPAHDAVWTQCVNVMLIYFVCILQMNLLRRGINLLRRRRRG